jgi:hypothetical protein
VYYIGSREKPHIEISLQGKNVAELIDWIKKKFEIAVLMEEHIKYGNKQEH